MSDRTTNFSNIGVTDITAADDITAVDEVIADTVRSVGVAYTVQANTATADGLTTGTIADEVRITKVTSADANHIIVLPTPTPGVEVTILPDGTTGYELRSSAPATVGINGGVGASAESAIGATELVDCTCRTATAWVCTSRAANGTVSATQVAA